MQDDPHRPERRRAVAITYNRNLPAPLVLAKGFGYRAEAIVAAAESSQVPVVRNDELSGELITLEIGNQIPESCYKVVAELLAFVYSIDSKKVTQ